MRELCDGRCMKCGGPVKYMADSNGCTYCTTTAGNLKQERDALLTRVRKLESAIRWHRDQWLNGDDKCWQDNETLYKLLPEGYEPPARDETVELGLCQKYIKSCHAPHIEYVSPQRRIEELEESLAIYASKENWCEERNGYDMLWMGDDHGWMIAEQALKGKT